MQRKISEILSPTSLDELQELGRLSGKNMIQKLGTIFLKESSQKMRILELSLQKNQFDIFHKTAHALKSDCIVIGAKRMEILCKQILDSSRSINEFSPAPLLQQLQDSFRETENAIRELILTHSR